MNLPKLVHSSQFTVHSKKNSVIREPITVNRRSWRLGFTLIELLVVIAIIGILIAAATVSYTKAQQKARDNRRKSDLKSVQQALELYFQQNGKYPSLVADVSSWRIRCNVNLDTSNKNWGEEFSCDENGRATDPPKEIYIQHLPKDPVGSSVFNFSGQSQYVYFASTSTTASINSYQLWAQLENTNDPDLSSLSCMPFAPYNYCVNNP